MWVITYVGRCGSCDWRVVNILDAIAENKVTDVQWAFEIEEDAVNAISKCINCIKGHPNLQLSKFCDLPYEDWKNLCTHIKYFERTLKVIDPSYNMGTSRRKNIINVIKPREKERKFFVIYDDLYDNGLMNPTIRRMFMEGCHNNVIIIDPQEGADEQRQYLREKSIKEAMYFREHFRGREEPRRVGRSTIVEDLLKHWESLSEAEQDKITSQAYGEAALKKTADNWENLTPEERDIILSGNPFKL
jgi:hypothetical protein